MVYSGRRISTENFPPLGLFSFCHLNSHSEFPNGTLHMSVLEMRTDLQSLGTLDKFICCDQTGNFLVLFVSFVLDIFFSVFRGFYLK